MESPVSITPQFYEKLIIKLLFQNQEMKEKIYPYLDPKYFDEDFNNQKIIKTLVDYMSNRDAFPNVSEMLIALKDKEVHQEFKNILAIDDKEYITDFILEEIEEFFKKKLLFHAAESLMSSIKEKPADTAGEVPEMISNALAFGFKSEIGLDFFEDEEKVYNSIHQTGNVLKTGLHFIDNGIDGGLHEKSLVLLMMETNLGKTMAMTSIGTELLLKNKNVLYITFEDPEEKISNRFLVNMLGSSVADLRLLTKDRFHLQYKAIKDKLSTKLIIKEYPEGTVSAFHIQQLLKELKIKKNFIPDAVFVDYLGCMIPNGRPNANLNSNDTLKLVTAQVRAISMKDTFPFVSAMQSNRAGIGKELTIDKAADSIGQTFKADGICAGSQTPEMKAAGMIQFEWIKSRYGKKRKFLVKYEVDLQRLSNITDDEDTGTEIVDGGDNLDNSVIRKYETFKKNPMHSDNLPDIEITFD